MENTLDDMMNSRMNLTKIYANEENDDAVTM